MIMTIPVGRDVVCAPLHRIYGYEGLPRLPKGYALQEAQYWLRDPAASAWTQVDREDALRTEGSEWFYALRLLVLSRGPHHLGSGSCSRRSRSSRRPSSPRPSMDHRSSGVAAGLDLLAA
jgi:hypothetical protein